MKFSPDERGDIRAIAANVPAEDHPTLRKKKGIPGQQAQYLNERCIEHDST
jgi:hypothetical protein